MKVITYLNFDGDCEEAFRFYADTLGGRIEGLMRYGGSPMAGDVPAEWHGRVMHASLHVGDREVFGSDSPPGGHDVPQGIQVVIHADGPVEAERIFHALAQGGAIRMPLEKTFWAERFGMVVDRFGTPWMVNCDPVEADVPVTASGGH